MGEPTTTIRRQIASAGELQSVVRTMKALAASNIGQYEKSIHALADYYRTVEIALGACFRQGESAGPVISKTPDPTRAIDVVVFGSDQGLVGRFNEVVADEALTLLAALPGRPRVWTVGARVHSRLIDANLAMMECFTLPSSVEAITPLVGQILIETETRHRQDEVPALHLVYNRVTAKASYAPASQRLLPLDDSWQRQLGATIWPTGTVPEVLGDRIATLRALLSEYLFISLFRACAESLASESSSRLAAMERADKNIKELLERLRGTFHRLRQSGIDEELFDVIAGFEALSK